MAKPELLVDQADRLVGSLALVGRDADVRQCKELKNMILVAPDRAQLILGPAALESRDDLVLAAALIGPAERAIILFEHVDGGACVTLQLIFIHVHSEADPGPLLFPRICLPCRQSARKAGVQAEINCGY